MANRHPEDPLLFAQAHRRFDGRPMEVPRALEAIYQDEHPFVVVQKPAQVGCTECMVNLALWCAATNQGGRGNVLYLMPTQENVDRLSQRRIRDALLRSPTLNALVTDAQDGSKPPQRIQMRQIGPGVVYLAGSEQMTQYIGVDADLVILDEFDQMSDDVLPQIWGRLRSSKLNRLRVISTPTIPEYGINALLQESDEQHYFLKCAACSSWTDPKFPENVDFSRNAVVCGCGAPLDANGEGEWRPTRPGQTAIRGYQLNRLVLPDPPLAQMKLASSGRLPISLEAFWRQDLGVPFVSEYARLSLGELDNCRWDWLPQLPAECYVMGIDVGNKEFQVVVRGYFHRHWYLYEATRVVGEWEQLDEFFLRYNIAWCVVDLNPDQRGARRFQQRHYGQVWCCLYKENGVGHDWSYDEDWTVKAVRTLALDEMFDAFRRGQYRIPGNGRDLLNGDYYTNLFSLVRVTEPDDFGQPLPKYKHTRPDDFAHAECYATLAALRLGRWHGWWDT